MKFYNIFLKNIREQFRSFWILLMTLISAPFFVFIYPMIIQSSGYNYRVQVLNIDKGAVDSKSGVTTLYSKSIIDSMKNQSGQMLVFSNVTSKDSALTTLKKKKSDLLLIFPEQFSSNWDEKASNPEMRIPIEFSGDVTSWRYLMAGVFIQDYLYKNYFEKQGLKEPFEFKETPLGKSSELNDFDIAVPGLIIFAIVMLMYTATIAFVIDSESGTIKRLKMAKVSTFTYIGGLSLVQILIGGISVIITYFTAIGLGFNGQGDFWALFIVMLLTCISIIAFSIILAAFCKNITQVVVIGTFPLFLFMFFSGSMFPIQTAPIFTIGSFDFGANGLISSTHAVTAINKIMVMNLGVKDIIPEIISLILLSIFYFIIGGYLYQRKHLRAVS
ncbi:MAG: ABC transporter permease [Bacteroidales bacterium]|nr:MAG: ABC transporter permease [Bacteroidales bacterium]